jgi:hypothetical protein
VFNLTVTAIADALTAIRSYAAFEAMHHANLRRLQCDDVLPHSPHWPHLTELALIGRDTVAGVTRGTRYVAIRATLNSWDVRYCIGDRNITARLGMLATPDVMRLFYITECFERSAAVGNGQAAAVVASVAPLPHETYRGPTIAPGIPASYRQYVSTAAPLIDKKDGSKKAPAKPLTPTQREFSTPIRRPVRRVTSNVAARIVG